MFDPTALAELARQHGSTFRTLLDLEAELNRRFFGMQAPVRCLLLSAATGEPMVMIGPPGTAKSRLIRSFCNLIGLLDDETLRSTESSDAELEEREERYFEYLLTQFTEPSELFGFFDLSKLFDPHRPEMVKDSSGMMQKAEVVFLDEVFNASSAILNALLTFMNERRFHDRGRIVRTRMRLLFSATNHPPQESNLAAFYDRFLLRCWLDSVAPDADSISELVAAAWTETHATPSGAEQGQRFASLLGDLAAYRRDVDAMTRAGRLRVQEGDKLFAQLAGLTADLRRRELSEMSNRRLAKFPAVFMASALLRAVETQSPPQIALEDLRTLLDFGLDRHEPNVGATGLLDKLGQGLAAAG